MRALDDDSGRSIPLVCITTMDYAYRQGTPAESELHMKIKDELRERQIAIANDFKSRAQKAEKIIGQLAVCEEKLSALNRSLSAVLLIDVMKAAAAAKYPKVKSAKTAKVVPVMEPPAGRSRRDIVLDLLAREGKPMRISELVEAMKRAGYVFQSKKPFKAVSKLLYNHPKVFKRVKSGTFKAV